MQLRTVGESLKAKSSIQTVLANTSIMDVELNGVLANALKGYLAEAVKMAIAQTTLNETKIHAILYSKGFRGQLLETTTAELAQVTATNALSVSENTAALSTENVSLAFQGLTSSISTTKLVLGSMAAVLAVAIPPAHGRGAAGNRGGLSFESLLSNNPNFLN